MPELRGDVGAEAREVPAALDVPAPGRHDEDTQVGREGGDCRRQEKAMRRPNWAIINRVRREKEKAREDRGYFEVSPGIFLKR